MNSSRVTRRANPLAAAIRSYAGRHRRLAAFAICLLLVASVSAAQRRRGFGGYGGFYGAPPKMATPQDFDGAFMFCRILFRNAPNGDGNGWGVDYPRADENLSFRLSELTKTPVSHDASGRINHVVVRLTDPLLFHCPFVMMTEPGGAYFDEAEATALREYVQKGGFLWADDFWGTYAFQFWADMIAKALPPAKYPIVDVPLTHPLFHVLYDVRRVPQIPSIGFWGGPGGRTSERGSDSAEAHVRAIFDDRGRMLVLMTHNTDFGDAFEREGDNYDYFLQFAPEGYAFGINVLIFSMAH